MGWMDGQTIFSRPEDANKRQQRIVDYAADGILHYAQYLSKEYSVIALAVSGESKPAMRLSAFIYPKNGSAPRPLRTRGEAEICELLTWKDFYDHAAFDPSVQRLRFDELMAFSRELHDFMREHAKLTENEKPLVVSGTLLALHDPGFGKAYNEYAVEDLPGEWMNAINRMLTKAKIAATKLYNVTQPYTGIAVHPELSKPTKAYPRSVLNELIKKLDAKVWPFINVYHDFDVVGQFYGEFLKYTGGDKKALGIVLTPRHVTELFSLLANVTKASKVLDICAGTGGFLIGAMQKMLRTAITAEDEKNIKSNGLLGIEQLPHMYALAASNMILRGDGKANLYPGSCFDEKVAELVSDKCDVGMVNPPYSQKDEDLHELIFVRQLLDLLVIGGTGIAIVPMNCAIAAHPVREEILRRHTLDAVMSMPDDLFYPVGTVTCIMVFTAHRPHAQTDKSTWFGYWKNDGFIKTKNKGRIDLNDRWSAIRDSWVEAFRNRDDAPGLSVKRKVTAADEWCAEAYMETDYQKVLSREAFEREIKKYFMFQLLNEATERAKSAMSIDDDDNNAAEGNSI